jgi:histone H3/H4
LTELPIATVSRIVKKAGIERIGKDASLALAGKAEAYIIKVAKDANALAVHAGRKTVKEEDIEMATNVVVS